MSTEQTDHRLLRQRLRAGDHDAFTTAYQQNLGGVFSLAHRLTGSRLTAEEVTAETFLVLWRSRTTIDLDDRPLQPWLMGICMRQSFNANRSARRRLAFLARRPAPSQIDDIADEAASRIDETRLLRRTQRALGLLSRAEAEVIALCVWSGLSYSEAAEAMGVPVGTVRSRLSRARARLRDLSEHEGPARQPDDRSTTPHREGRSDHV